ncbi:MAG: hypothetical protein IKH71_09775 [Oscillospiraceae bacterium]|nr:hypothetical protein [Oscillospiraceae bacterium]MBR6837774.1 hypothetical protein [Oscillospiraceae bacterium]
MNSENKSLLINQLEELKKNMSLKRLEDERKRITENTDNFFEKYRFADESECAKIEEFILKFHLHLRYSASTALSKICDSVPRENMYLCFFSGSEELLKIFIFGKFSDLIADIDTWDFFSPYLLLIDEDFRRYIYIDDNGDMTESIL